jgi:superfamily II helicase
MKDEQKQQETTKVCKVCHIEKPLEDFAKGLGMRDGRRTICKKCFNEHTRTIKQEARDRFPF